MFFPIYLLFMASPRTFENRIIGGNVAKISQFPYMVSIQKQCPGNPKSSTHICGGSIVKPYIILSAAHCFFKKGAVRVIEREIVTFAGMTELEDKFKNQRRTTKEIIIHQSYDPEMLYNDIAFVILTETLKLDMSVQTVTLATKPIFANQTPWEVYKNSCFASGWGVVSEDAKAASDFLRTVELPLISFDECDKLVYEGSYLHAEQICTLLPGSDTCKGDSGGPLVCNGTQVGITSWGQGCAESDNPGILTRVDQYDTWISEIVNGTAPPRWKSSLSSIVSFPGIFFCTVLFVVTLYN